MVGYFVRVSCLLIFLANCFSQGVALSPPEGEQEHSGTFAPAACPFDVPQGLVEGKTIKCGYVTVPEFHAKPDARTLRLAVAVFPSLSDNPSPDPFVLAPAGPGNSALGQSTDDVASPLGASLRAERDVVLIDYRGLYYAKPALLCPEVYDYGLERLIRNLSADRALQLWRKSVLACRNRLEKEGVNLNAFNEVEMAADLAMVMTALEYEKFNLYGTSGGTILVQLMLRDYPQRLRSVIIDSTVPLARKTLHSELPAIAAHSLRRLFEMCAADPSCAKAYPGLDTAFAGLSDRLNERPVKVEGKHPVTGQTMEVVFNGDLLAEGLSMVSTQTAAFPWLPGFIYKLTQGDYSQLGEMISAVLPPGGKFTLGLTMSVFCSQFTHSTDETILFAGLYPTYEETVADSMFGPRGILRTCEIWKVDKVDPRYRQAVRSEVPTLLIAGELDNLTPPSWAREVAENLGHAYLYEIPGYGHGPTFVGSCPASIALQFLKDPTTAPDASCIAGMRTTFSTPQKGQDP